MVRLRIMVRGSEQCVRLIWSVIVLRVGAIQNSDIATQCLVSKAAKFIAREPWLGAGSCTEGTPGSIILRVLTPMRVQSHAWSFIPGWSFLKFFYPRAETPDICTPSSRAPEAAPAPTSRGRLGELTMQRKIKNAIPDLPEAASQKLPQKRPLVEVFLEGHVGCGTATRGAAHLPQTYFVVSSELEWRPMA